MRKKKYVFAIIFQIICFIAGLVVAVVLSLRGIVLGRELSIFPAITVAFLVIILLIEIISVLKITDSTVHTVLTAAALLAGYLTSADFMEFLEDFGIATNPVASEILHFIAFHAVMLANVNFLNYTYGLAIRRKSWAIILAVSLADCALYGVLCIFGLQYIAFFIWLPVCVFMFIRAYLTVAADGNDNRIFYITTTVMSAEVGMQTVEELNFSVALTCGVSGFATGYTLFIVCCFAVIYMTFIFLTERNSVKADEYRLQAEIMKTRVLQQQINPHYIYNSLTTVKEMYHHDCESGDKAINLFAKHLRANVNGMTTDLIPFEEEIENIQNYLGFENLRREKPIEVIYNIEYSDFCVPSLSLQVFVENAVRHGKVGDADDGVIEISAAEQGGEIVVGITDNGVGFNPEQIKEDSCGINNSRARLSLLVGGKVEIESAVGRGTEVKIRLKRRYTDRKKC